MNHPIKAPPVSSHAGVMGTLTDWLGLASPRLNDREEVQLRNDVLHVCYERTSEPGQVLKTWTLIGARRITEAKTHGLPLQGSSMVTLEQANAQIHQLLVEARHLNHSSAAFYGISGGPA